MFMRQPRPSAHRKRFVTGIGAAVFVAIFTHALTPLHAKANRPKLLYWHGDSLEKKVALTFDDGPNEPYTSEVLKILKDNNIRATFFLVGENVATYPEAARAVVAAGHAIGNHSYDHRNLLTRTNAQVRAEILKTEEIIQDATGVKTTLFRPPYGDKDTLTLQQTRKLGYIMVEWSVSAEDWRKPGPEKIVKNVMKRIHSGDIILMHDGDKWRHGSDRSQTVQALPMIIAQLRQEGYEFVTIPELLKLDVPGPVQTAKASPTPSPSAKL
jgi:polysaccharide deacetylase family sporulation protein PdaB